MDTLKSAWQSAGNGPRDIKIVRPPVLKDIRRQLTIETICYCFFLVVYYNFFDGEKHSFLQHFILVGSVSLLLLHNISGYMITNHPVQGEDLKQSLSLYLSRLKRYALLSVASRAVAFSGIMLFFMWDIRWTASKYYGLVLIICLLGLQVFSLGKIWAGRIRKIRGILYEL
jgi:hypothetical protein